jgi:uncharacterized protein (DUF1697 family)
VAPFEHCAFLRGMNVGGHRITNEQLRVHAQALGFGELETFRASGNLVFDGGGRSDEELQELLETGLRDSLGYAVPTFIRSRAEMLALACADPFAGAPSAGKLQVALLWSAPAPVARAAVLAQDCAEDRLAFGERELFWLPAGPMSESSLDWKQIERSLGATTVRTKGTVEQIARRYFDAAAGEE